MCLTWTALRALIAFPRIEAIRRGAALLLFTLILQLLLGFAAFLTRIAWPGTEANNSMVFSTVAHTSVGALLLAITAVLTIQVWRHAPMTQKQEIPEGRPAAA
jgi:predicted ABC-type exoprotein transport system permease subunit